MNGKVSARVRFLPGNASKYIRPLCIKPGDRVILCCRVSHCQQQRRRNLDDQEASLRQAVAERGGVVVEVARHVGSGCDPIWLADAAQKAKEQGAVLLAETTDRFIRHPRYHSSNWPDLQAREPELYDLRLTTRGIPLMTLVDPDATPCEVRAQQTRRGQSEKGRKGGRPVAKRAGYKKQIRGEKLPEALKLWESGKSVRHIVQELGVPKSTIQDWISRHR